MLGRGRAWTPEVLALGAATGAPASLMSRFATRCGRYDCHRIQPPVVPQRHNITLWKYHGERARPVCFRQFFQLPEYMPPAALTPRREMLRDQRIVGRAAFRCVNLLCRSLIQRVGTEGRTPFPSETPPGRHHVKICAASASSSSLICFVSSIFTSFCIHRFTFFAIALFIGTMILRLSQHKTPCGARHTTGASGNKLCVKNHSHSHTALGVGTFAVLCGFSDGFPHCGSER